MANPSLQIGNSNWAIKEDNLLGYSTAGTRFLPQPITMTRASAGTRVNPQGLVETVELLGSELVTNGDFSNLFTGWIAEGGSSTWIAEDNVAKKISSSNFQLYQTITRTVGKTYQVNFDVEWTSGTLILSLGGGTSTNITSSGNYSFNLVWDGSSSNVIFRSTFIGSIDNVSVKESTKNNLARVDYDGTASSLLVEPQRTNIVPYSEDFSNADWIKSAASVVSGFTSPDGTDNAFKLVEDTSTGIHRISVDGITVVTEKYSVSIYAKSDGRNEIRVSLANYFSSGTDAYFNLDTKVITLGSLAENGLIETLSNGWFRCSFTSKNVGFAGGNAKVHIDTALNGSTSYTGDGTSGVYIYGAQLEEGAYPTSYIPTDGGTVTRVQDQYTKTGISNLIGQTEGVVFLDFELQTTNEDIVMMNIYNEATPTNSIFFYITTSNRLTAYCDNSGSQAAITSSVLAQGRYKAAFSYKANDFKLYLNGSLVGVDVSGTVPTCSGFRLINLASSLIYQEKIGIYNAQIYNTALSPSQLIALTS